MLSETTARFRGAHTTLMTPFDARGEVDEAVLRRIVDFQIASGAIRLCPNGVTGEAAALTDEEKLRITSIVVKQAAGRAMVIPDVGTECLRRTIDLARETQALGVDGLLAFTPFLDPPTDSGMVEYFTILADAVELPLLMHNLPARTTVDLKPHIAAQLADHPRIVGLKEGNQDVVRLRRLIHLLRDKDFVVLSGNDFTALVAMLFGGHGHVSVAANVIPRQSIAIVEAALRGDFVTASELYMKYAEFYRGIYLATNPIALKRAFSLAHFEVGDPRVPLTPLSAADEQELVATMRLCEINATRSP